MPRLPGPQLDDLCSLVRARRVLIRFRGRGRCRFDGLLREAGGSHLRDALIVSQSLGLLGTGIDRRPGGPQHFRGSAPARRMTVPGVAGAIGGSGNRGRRRVWARVPRSVLRRW